MSKLVLLTKADKKKLGIVDSKEGLMWDRKRLVEIKRMQAPSAKAPKVKTEVKNKDERLGIY